MNDIVHVFLTSSIHLDGSTNSCFTHHLILAHERSILHHIEEDELIALEGYLTPVTHTHTHFCYWTLLPHFS